MYKHKNYKSTEKETIEETQIKILDWFVLKSKDLSKFEVLENPLVYDNKWVVASSKTMCVAFPKNSFQNVENYTQTFYHSYNFAFLFTQNMKLQIDIFLLARLLNIKNSNLYLVKFLGSYFPAHRLKLLVKAAFNLGVRYIHLFSKTGKTTTHVFEVGNAKVGILPLLQSEYSKNFKRSVLNFRSDVDWAYLQNVNEKYLLKTV